jgi:hypothetical protein
VLDNRSPEIDNPGTPRRVREKAFSSSTSRAFAQRRATR